MIEAELFSYFFIKKEWEKISKMPMTDKGFEDSFRHYIYDKIKPDYISNKSDYGLGLKLYSYSTLQHELDVIYHKGNEKVIFELKNYSETRLNKEIFFTFLLKVFDFYLRNASLLSKNRLTLIFLTINKDIDDSIRKFCIAYGIKLIEPSLLTIGLLDYFSRDLYEKISNNSCLKVKTEKLIDEIFDLQQKIDFSFSDFFKYENYKIIVDDKLLILNVQEILEKIKSLNLSFNRIYMEWKHERT